MKADLTVEFNKFLSNIEVDKVGVISLEDYRDSKAWQQARNLLPESKSVVVLALEIFPEVIKHLSSKNLIGEIALRDLFSRNIEIINARIDWEAHKIVKKLHTLGYSALCLPAGGAPLESRFLEGAFSYKHAAHAAGLGVIGWHSMLITPEYGTRVRLAVILTNAQLKPKISIAGEIPCIQCGGACIKICPANAIAKPRKNEQWNINKYACNTYLKATVSCSECLKVCPAGKA